MIEILTFDSQFAALLPDTHALVMGSHLVVHHNVSRVVLHGSRGPAGGCRPTSDVDLSLLVDVEAGWRREDIESLLQDVMQTSLSHWQGRVELDLAAIFDVRNCGLKCFDEQDYDEMFCTIGGIDCFGLYKVQKGFHGFVTNARIQVRKMYPCLKIWQRT